MEDLQAKNINLKEKMLTLMDLTRGVLLKIKTQERQEQNGETSRTRAIEHNLDDQLDQLNKRVSKEYAIVKRQQDTKVLLHQEMLKNDNEFDAYKKLQDVMKEWDKEKAELTNKLIKLKQKQKATEKTINQTQGTDRKTKIIQDFRQQISDTKEIVKHHERRVKEQEPDDKREWDILHMLKQENQTLKRDYIKVNNMKRDGIQDMMHLREEVKYTEQTNQLSAEVKRTNGELIMKEKNHFQKQYDFLQKAQKYDDEIKDLHNKAMALNDENNTMWGEISDMNMMLPSGAAK